MIVDTSALVAILIREPGWEAMRAALVDETARLPAPALVEFVRVAASERLGLAQPARALIDAAQATGLEIVAFTAAHAALATTANARFGAGQRQGGKLNVLDLMVYAVARDYAEPVLCTGSDFAATDIALHPASRTP